MTLQPLRLPARGRMQVWLAPSNGRDTGERLVVDPGEAIGEIGVLTSRSLVKLGGSAVPGAR